MSDLLGKCFTVANVHVQRMKQYTVNEVVKHLILRRIHHQKMIAGSHGM